MHLKPHQQRRRILNLPIWPFSKTEEKKDKNSSSEAHLINPTKSMIMRKLGGYSARDLCWYRQQGTNILTQPITVVESICTAPERQDELGITQGMCMTGATFPQLTRHSLPLRITSIHVYTPLNEIAAM